MSYAAQEERRTSFAAASSLEEKLAGYVSRYEQVMIAAGRELPYPARSK